MKKQAIPQRAGVLSPGTGGVDRGGVTALSPNAYAASIPPERGLPPLPPQPGVMPQEQARGMMPYGGGAQLQPPDNVGFAGAPPPTTPLPAQAAAPAQALAQSQYRPIANRTDAQRAAYAQQLANRPSLAPTPPGPAGVAITDRGTTPVVIGRHSNPVFDRQPAPPDPRSAFREEWRRLSSDERRRRLRDGRGMGAR